jgi:hypothetical protein
MVHRFLLQVAAHDLAALDDEAVIRGERGGTDVGERIARDEQQVGREALGDAPAIGKA